MTGHTVTIVPPDPGSSGHTMTQGTKVLADDGSEIGGVSKIVLTAEVNDLWRAVIYLNPRLGHLHGIAAEFVMAKEEAIGDEIETTHLQSEAREYASASQADRIEAKLDALIAALAEQDEQEPSITLDGDEAGGERDTNQPL